MRMELKTVEDMHHIYLKLLISREHRGLHAPYSQPPYYINDLETQTPIG